MSAIKMLSQTGSLTDSCENLINSIRSLEIALIVLIEYQCTPKLENSGLSNHTNGRDDRI